MPAGFHVASAYVDIHAEDGGLRGEIKRAIEGAAAGADAKIKLNLDTAGLRSKVEAAIKGAGANQKIKVGVNVDTAGLRSKISAAMNAAGANQKVKVSVNVDTAGLRSKVSAAISAAGTNQKVKVGLKLDTAGFRAAVSAAVSAASTGQKVKIGTKLDTAGLRAQVSAATAEAGAGQNVHIGTNIDRNGLASASNSIRSIANDTDRIRGGSRGGNDGGILGKRSGLGGLSYGTILAGLSMLEPALGALIAPTKAVATASLALVPALLGVGLMGAAAVVGVKGVGTAMKAANKDSADYGTALDKLAPSAQDFVRSTAGMQNAFSNMKLQTQQELFKGLGSEMTKLGGTALPIITAGLAGMAGIMNTAFKGVTQTVGQLADNGQLAAMFGGIQTAFKPLTAIPGQFIDMLTKVSIAASPLLTRITQGIAGGMTNLTDRVTKAFDSGQLQAKIDSAGQSIHTFFTNFKNNGAVQDFVQNLKSQGPSAANALQKIGEASLHLLNSSSGVGAALLKIGGSLATVVNAVPSGALTTIMALSGGLRLISVAGGGLTRASAAITRMGSALGVVGTSRAAVSGQATALSGLATAGTRANAALGGAALSANAIRAQAASMAESGIAARSMSTKMAAAGTVLGTYGATAGTTSSKMAALKGGAIALVATWAGMKGVDAIMGKVFGKAASVSQMAKAFTDFSATGQLTGITAKSLGNNFGKFGEALQKVAHNDPIGKIKNSLARGFAWTGLDAFKDHNKDLVKSVDDTLASLVKAGNSDVAGKMFNTLASAAEKSGVSVGKLKSMMTGYNQSLKEQKVAEQVAAAAMGTYGTEAISTQKILAKNNGELQGIQASYFALGRSNASATGAQLNYNQSVSQASALMKQHTNALSMQGGLLNTTTPKAQAAAAAMLNIAETAKKAGEAFTGKGDFAARAQTIDQARAAMMKLGQAQGLSAAQAREFVNQVMPIDRAKEWGQAIASTAGQMKTLTTAMAKAPDMQKVFKFNPNTITSQARAGLDSLKGVMTKTLDNGKLQVKIDTSSAKRQVSELNSVMQSLKTKGTQTIKMPAQDVSAMANAAKAMGMSVKNLGNGKIKITAQDGASAVIQGIKGKLDGLKDKKLKIDINTGSGAIKGADTFVGKSIAAAAKEAGDPIRKYATGVKDAGDKTKDAAGKFPGLTQNLHQLGKAAGDASPLQAKHNATLQKLQDLISSGKMQAHGKGPGGFGTGLTPSTDDIGKLKSFTDMFGKLGGAGKGGIQVAVMISGTEQIDKLKALNGVKNKVIQVSVNISGTEQIDKLKALNAVNNKTIQVSVNISGTEDIDKLKALNSVNNKVIQVSVNISGTEDIDKLKALNAVNNKIIQVSVNISGTEDIDKLKALNAVNNKSIQVAVNISGTEDIDKLKALNSVNNKTIQVSVNISGTEQIDKLKALNSVNNKTIQVSVAISGTEQIDKLKALNQVNNKTVQVSVAISGTEQIDKLKALNQVNNKSIQVAVSVSGTEQIDKLKALNQVNNKSVTVNVSVSGADQIDKLKELNKVNAKNISVNVSITGADQISKLKDLNNLPSSKSVTITVTANAGPVTQIKSAIQGISNKTVTVTVSANAGPIQSVKAAIASISNKSVTVSVNANAGPVQSVKAAIAGISNKTVTVTVSANAGQVQSLKAAIAGVVSKSVTVTANASSGQVNSLKAAISSLQGKTVTVTANVNGTGAVQALVGAIAAVQSKTVTVTVNTVKTGSAAGGGLMSHETIPGFSAGGRSYKPGGGVYGIGSGTSDSIMARLSNGEFVIRAAMVKKYGTAFLTAINHGALGPMLSNMKNHKMPALPRFATGGSISLGDVQPGDRGSEVLMLQKALKDLYPSFDYSSGPGTFGPQTKKYYSMFQQSMGWSGQSANGSPGMLSLIALMNRTSEFQLKASSATVKYIVQYGDTLTTVAKKFGVSVDQLLKVNAGLNANSGLHQGNNINIPTGYHGVPGTVPAVIPGTKPGDWNYLEPPKFSTLSRKKDTAEEGKAPKDVTEVNTLMGLAGQNMEKQTKMFENLTGTNSDSLVNKIAEATDMKSLASTLDEVRSGVFNAFKDSSGRTKLQDYLARGSNIEIGYQKMLDTNTKSLEDAKKALDDVNSSYKSLKDSIQSTVAQFATLTKTGKAGANTETMIRQLTKDAGTTQAFSQGLTALQGRGLNGDTLAQIGALGPVEGLRTINSLVQASPEQIAQINALQTQITAASEKASTTAADAMYKAGINASQGLVDGLTAQKTQIEAAMKQIAEAMKSAILQALGIKSPSRVMHGYGVNTVQGLIRGISSERHNVADLCKDIAEKIHFDPKNPGAPGQKMSEWIKSCVKGKWSDKAAGADDTKTIPDFAKTMVDEVRRECQKGDHHWDNATPGSSGHSVGGNITFGDINVTFQCDGDSVKSPEDAKKFADQMTTYIMDKIREENRKRS